MYTFHKRYLCVTFLLAVMFVLPGLSFAQEVAVDFERSYQTSVAKAYISNQSTQEITVAGHLRKPFLKMSMLGHLHSYSYSTGGELISESKHRVSSLNSKREKRRRVPFEISINNDPEEVSRIFLEYHRTGHC